jgi:alpha,alpha-trehalose phosphorylase
LVIVWSALVFRCGGVRDFDGHLSFAPRLPRDWDELTFTLRFCDRQLRVRLTHQQECYQREDGRPLHVAIRDERHLLSKHAALSCKPPPGRRGAAGH